MATNHKWLSCPRPVIAACLVLILVSELIQHADSQGATSCSSNGFGSGSGEEIACGDNAYCLNNVRCECDTGYFSPTGSNTDCRDNNEHDSRCSQYDTRCVFCGSNFEGPCQKCTGVIYQGQCFDVCPHGTNTQVSTLNLINLPYRNCVASTETTVLLQEWAIIVIVALGLIILVVIAVLIAAIACTCLRRANVGQLDIADRQAQHKSEEAIPNFEENDNIQSKDDEETDTAVQEYFEPETDTYDVNDKDKDEFFGRLELLRSQSEVFLKMLNDMRRRLKEIPQNSQAVQQYKTVMRDLTRLLYMLNKNPQTVRIPPDGLQLLMWSEEILNRYLLAQGKPPVPSYGLPPPSNSPERFSTIGDTAETDF